MDGSFRCQTTDPHKQKFENFVNIYPNNNLNKINSTDNDSEIDLTKIMEDKSRPEDLLRKYKRETMFNKLHEKMKTYYSTNK